MLGVNWPLCGSENIILSFHTYSLAKPRIGKGTAMQTTQTENKLASGAILVDFSISVWSGRRQAKDEAAAVTTKAKAVKDSASVSKHLMVGTSELVAVQSAGVDLRRFI